MQSFKTSFLLCVGKFNLGKFQPPTSNPDAIRSIPNNPEQLEERKARGEGKCNVSGDESLGTRLRGNRGLVVKSIMVTLSEGLVISQTNVASVSSAVKSTTPPPGSFATYNTNRI